jgi:hypothetical protein
MTEESPFNGPDDMEPTKLPLKGPNVISTFDSPPHPDAIKVHDAAMRRHIKASRPRREPPQGDAA